MEIVKETLFTCNFNGCDKTFKYEGPYKRHLKAHDEGNVVRSICPYENCKKEFLGTGFLSRHIKMKHELQLDVKQPEIDIKENFAQLFNIQDYELNELIKNFEENRQAIEMNSMNMIEVNNILELKEVGVSTVVEPPKKKISETAQKIMDRKAKVAERKELKLQRIREKEAEKLAKIKMIRCELCNLMVPQKDIDNHLSSKHTSISMMQSRIEEYMRSAMNINLDDLLGKIKTANSQKLDKKNHMITTLSL